MPSDELFGPALGTPEMDAAVSGAAWLTAMLRFESALAESESELGLIPAEAAAEIAAACRSLLLDPADIGHVGAGSASPAVPLVEALRQSLPESAAPFAHHGATSQDVLDTALMLVARDAIYLLLAGLDDLAAECADLADRYRDTPMSGRTLLQRALPITFGFKAANWLLSVLEARSRLAGFREQRLAVQLGGPTGTLDAFGDRGFQVMAGVARRLRLPSPPVPWHTDRSRIAELGSALAMAAGAAAKIGLDIVLLAQTEVGEVAEAAPGRSSAMPHKRNPAHAIEARAAYAGTVAQAGLLLGLLAGEHERSAGAWQAEAPAITEAFRLTAGAIEQATGALNGLQVDTDRMLANLGLASGAAAERLGSAGAIVDLALERYQREVRR